MKFILLDAELVTLIHDEILKYGKGLPGISKDKSLSAALNRLETKCYYEGVHSIYEAAAFYCVSIARGHLFVDANKRTAFMTMYIFLAANDYLLTASDYNTENEEMMEKIAKKEIGENELAVWLKQNTQYQPA